MGKQLTDKDFKDRVLELVGNEYIFLEEYKGRHSKIKCKHTYCQHIWYVEAGAFLGNKNKKGSRCPSCYGNTTKTSSIFRDEVANLTNNEYTLVSEYKNAHTKVVIHHTLCGNDFSLAPNTFLGGSRCPICNPVRPYDQKRAEERIKLETDSAFVLVSEYKGCYKPMTLKHNLCGNTINITMQGVDAKRINCPYCFNKSAGETLVANYLEKRNIKFEIQKRFDGFKRFPYDFYIPEKNTIIEYHGIQHYEPVKFYGGTERFERQVQTDKKKKDYALNHNFSFIEIDYTHNTQQSVNTFLDSFFK